jgi:hypothetical protein
VEDGSCLFYSEKETAKHLCFDYVVAKQCWFVISEIVGLHVGESIVEIGKFWLSDKNFSMINIITSAVLWSIWNLSDDLCFQHIG